MAFRLRPAESVSQGLRRLAAKELRSARDELRRTTPPRDVAILEARKSVKKVRAIVQLIKDDDGRLAGGLKRLRTINRRLSELRDADAVVGILATLRSRNPRLFSEHTFARVRRHLLARKQAAMEAAERDGTWKKVGKELRKLRRAAKRWRPTHRGFAALAPGIRVSHQRGRKALARARKRHRASDFHEWRKQIKALWYELRLVEGRTQSIRRDVRALHLAATWLGDDHNVTVLCAELSKRPSICGGPEDLVRLRLAADRYQRDLRKKSIHGAQRIYVRAPGDYQRGVKRAWKAWRRRQDRARHVHESRRTAA
jgi:hypothetical protein